MLQNVKAGQMIPLAIAEPQRMPILPNIPTVAETVPGFDMTPWIGVIAPIQTPKDIVVKLTQATLAVMRDPELIKTLEEQQVTPYTLEPAQFTDLIKTDLEKWARVIKSAGIKAE